MEKVKKYALMLVLIFLFNITYPTIEAMAIDNASTILSIENPINDQKLTSDFLLKGFAISMNKVSKIDVYLDDIIKGQAEYGISRSDIESKYSNYPDAGKSGFKYKFTNVANGKHIIKVVVTDTEGKTQEQSVSIVVDNTKTMIIGKGTLNREQMIKKLRERNKNLSLKYISDFVDYTISEANIEGVNYDILFSQMMHETGYLNFGGDVKPEQNNFAGIGATGGVPGESFKTVQIGIRAVVQHLKAYASNEALNQECVDPRFKYVIRGSAICVEHLGIQENPDGKGWAAARGYGYRLLTVQEDIANVSSTLDFSVINDININGNSLEGNVLTLSVISTPINDTLYKVIVKDENNNITTLSDWSLNNTVKFTPTRAGKYTFTVYAKHKNATSEVYNDVVSKEVVISPGKSQVTSLSVTGDKYVGSTLTMKAEGTPAADTLYKLWVCDRSTNTWTVLSDYSTKSSVEFKPTKAGKYSFVVHVKHKSKSGAVEDDYRVLDVQVTEPKSEVTSLTVTGDKYVGSTLTMKAEGTPAADTLYKLWVCDRSTNTWTVLSDYSTKSSVEFKPTKVGTYSFVVHAKHKSKSGAVEDDYRSVDVQVTATPKSKVTSLNVTGTAMVGYTLTMKAEGTPATDTLYKLWVCDRSTNTWTVLSDYSTKSSVEFKPTKAGTYSFVVHAKHKSKSGIVEDDYRVLDVQITELKSKVTSLNVTGTAMVGSTLTMKAEGEPAADTLYKLWVCDRSTNTWTVLSDYSTKSSVEFKPTKAGKYTFTVHAKHKSKSGTVEDDYKAVDVQVVMPTSTISSMSISGNTEFGNSVTLSVEGSPAENTLYKLWVCDRSTNTWTVLSDWSTKNSIQYTPEKIGKYTFTAYAKNKYSNSAAEDVALGKDFYVTEKGKSMAISLGVIGSMNIGEKINISSLAAPENDTLYKIWICERNTGTWMVLSDWSKTRTASYIPEKGGRYTVVVHVKHKNSQSASEDGYLSQDINVKGKKVIVIDPGHNHGGDYGSVSTHNGITYSETELNMQVSLKLKAELERRGYQVVMTRNQGEISKIGLYDSLKRRVEIANNLDADLFISIHHNKWIDPSVRGVEVYYSSEAPIITGIRNASKISESKTLATNMVNNLSSRIGYVNRGPKDNDFYVVKNTIMPSVLVECGFISNLNEALMVSNPAIQQKFAEALADAVSRQF